MPFTTQERIARKVQSLLSVNTKYYRENILNILPHVLDFSFQALKHSSPDLTSIEYALMVKSVSKLTNEFDSLESAMYKLRRGSTPVNYVILVKDSTYGTYVVAKNYRILQSTMSAALKDIESGGEFTGRNEQGQTVINIGHIASEDLIQTRSPLTEKIQRALNNIPFSIASAKIMEKLDILYNEHTLEATYQFKRNSFDTTKFSKILGQGTILVTLHTAKFNNELATQVESAIERDIRKYVSSSEFIKDLPEDIGSNSIKEDIAKAVTMAIEGKSFKSTHSSHKPITTKQTFKTGKSSVPVTSIKVKNIRTNRNISLSSLTTLLNFHLHDVVAANMGDGKERRILNYRTGRFATSTKVIKTVQTQRDGLITVFYDYMKNPYSTFSEGGAQQYPRSRDPKLLISKSIRQIGATIVSNRMKAVLV